MKRTPHRLPRRPLAAAVAAVGLLGLVTAVPRTASPATAVPVAASENTATVFYYTKTRNWSTYNLHYAPDGGSWTTVPGVQMVAACTDWVKKTVSLGSASGLAATFNNGSGVWDNNAGNNYALGTGTITVKDGVVAHSAPCADTGTEPTPTPTPDDTHTASVYYSTATVGWTTTNLHYQPEGGSWTAVPGGGGADAEPSAATRPQRNEPPPDVRQGLVVSDGAKVLGGPVDLTTQFARRMLRP
ncbi:carbohydrate binding domain-containing protein [Streptomyces sp. NPDC056227]|uniref:carbohydrate binding domain-containing protein n=1 Tax=Streptomyces sp. NPDC056227 TaxID=3345753 RepID=UPI0035DE1995